MSVKKYSFILITLFIIAASCTSVKKIERYETRQYRFSDSTSAAIDSSTYYLINPYRTELNKTMSEILAVSDQPLEKKQPEGTLGNFVADLAISEAQKLYENTIDFCVLNNGGLRASLPKGNITLKNVYSLMPFENELVILSLDGSTANKLFNYIAFKGGVPVSKVQLKIKDQQALNIKVNGSDFDSTKTYRVVTSDYLANGGDNLEFLKGAIKKEYTGLKVRDAIIGHLREQTLKGYTISVALDNRITHER